MNFHRMLAMGLTAAMLTACGHTEKESAQGGPSAAGTVAAAPNEAANPSAVAEVDACKLLSMEEAATVLNNPGSPEQEDLGISKECKYSHDEDHLQLFVDIDPHDKKDMATSQALYDPKDIISQPGVGDVAFEFFPNRAEIREQSRSILALKGSRRFRIDLYLKTGGVGEPYNAKFVAVAKAVADRL